MCARWISSHIARLYTPPTQRTIPAVGQTPTIHLALNENPYGPSPHVLEAIRRVETLHRYPDAEGTDLCRILAAYHGVSMHEIALGAGIAELVRWIVLAMLTPDDHAIIVRETFRVYRAALEIARIPYTAVPLQNGKHDLEGMLRSLRPNTKIVFLANPNNPTGTYIRRSDFENFLSQLPPQVLLVHDEAYVHYVDRDDYPVGVDYYRRGYPVLTLRTFSKAYGLAGLRIGYAIGPREVIQGIHTVRPAFNISRIAQIGAIAAFRDVAYLQTTVQATLAQRAWLVQRLTEMGFPPYPTVANFVCIHVPDDAQRWFQELALRGVLVRPLTSFGMPRGLRITVGRPEENAYFIEKLEEIIRS